MYFLIGGGAGAIENYDGLPLMLAPCILGNMGYEFIEVVELGASHIVREVSVVPHSGGLEHGEVD